MVVVERQASGQDPPRSYNGATRKIQSPSCSAISAQSDDEAVNYTGCTELSAVRDRQPNSSNRRFPNAHEISSNGTREYQDNLSPRSNHWDGHNHSVHGNSLQSNESALSAMLAEIISPSNRMEAPSLSERQKINQMNFKRVEEAANLLEAQLDEVESSHCSYGVNAPTRPIRWSAGCLFACPQFASALTRILFSRES
jgi:hypothetical protein